MFTTLLLNLYISFLTPVLPAYPSPVTLHAAYNNNAGLANGSEINIYTGGRTLNELVATVIHEVGHNIDDGNLVGVSGNLSDFREFGHYLPSDDKSLEYYRISWQNEDTRTGTFYCSRYGKTDPFEDFAECFTLYVINGRWFKAQEGEAVAKYEYIKALFGGREFLNEVEDWDNGQYASTRAQYDINNIFKNY